MDKDTNFSFYSSKRNENFLSGLVDPLRKDSASFLSNIDDKAKKYGGENRSGFLVKTQPKWITELVNHETGEVVISDDFTRASCRKYKAVDKFVSTYSSPYYHKTASLLFHTFTQVNMSNYVGIKPVLEAVKYRYECIRRPLLGYVWVLECSRNFHIHYHLCTAIDRFDVTRIPDELKFEGLWGRRTGVEFVKGDVGKYMQKKALGGYMSKHARLWERYQIRKGYTADDLKVMRQFGKSRQYKLPVNCQ